MYACMYVCMYIYMYIYIYIYICVYIYIYTHIHTYKSCPRQMIEVHKAPSSASPHGKAPMAPLEQMEVQLSLYDIILYYIVAYHIMIN